MVCEIQPNPSLNKYVPEIREAFATDDDDITGKEFVFCHEFYDIISENTSAYY